MNNEIRELVNKAKTCAPALCGNEAVCYKLALEVERLDNIDKETQVELINERLRLAACGVAAMSNTPESFKEITTISPDCYSTSLIDVMRAVNTQINMRAALVRAKEELTKVVKELSVLLGNQQYSWETLPELVGFILNSTPSNSKDS